MGGKESYGGTGSMRYTTAGFVVYQFFSELDLMKKVLFPFLVLGATVITSCGWPKEDIDSLRTACMEDARTWAAGPDQAKTYCDCVVEKVMKKYPRVTDAMENMDKI